MARNGYTHRGRGAPTLVRHGPRQRIRRYRETIPSMSSTPERRRHPRIPVSWPVRLWVDDEPLLGRAEDASRNGLWVTVPSSTALRLGKICWVDVLSDELGSFTVAGEVRHVNGRRIGLETTRPVPLAGLERT